MNNIKKNNYNILAIGEILFDIYPELNHQQTGGAPFNYLFHLNNLNCNVFFVSRIGKDKLGNQIFSFLKSHKFPADFIQQDNKHKTGQVIIELDNQGTPKFNILDNVTYDYIEHDDKIEKLLMSSKSVFKKVDMIYFGTLCQRNKISRSSIMKLLGKAKDILKFYDINLRQNFHSKIIISRSLRYCDILKLNTEESKILQKHFNLSSNIDKFIVELSKLFKIKTICLTQGEKGNLLYHNNKIYKKKLSKAEIVDSVGAGDAFAAVLSLGILNKWPPEFILEKASELAYNICNIKGAIPGNKKFYKKFKESFDVNKNNKIRTLVK